MADILKIGASGVSTMQKGLQTTSNNITNVNSEGYTRQRLVTYTNTPMLGAGKSIVERLSNEFAQAEMWRDTSDSAYYNKVYEQLYSTDQLLSGEGTSLADGISGIFSAVEYAACPDHYGKYLIHPHYINAGVLLFNMKKARETALFDKARAWIKKKKLVFADQSALIRSTTKKKVLKQRFNDQKFLHGP